MKIEIWSDIVCPWCYLGKHRLDEAVRSIDGPVTVAFRSYQLDPSPIPRPVPLLEWLSARFGAAAGAQMARTVTGVAAASGLVLNFDIAIAANTFDAHRLVGWAAGQGRQLDMVEALHRAHFTDGVDLGSPAALADVAAGLGLDGTAARAYLDTPAGAERVRADLAEARQLGITSVPTFVIDGKYAVSGAQEAATLRAALTEISRAG
ncbi:MAG TPA: DsbA family oxidoreductase [Actinoplanes sp.]|nr:DsbA family oxidoreductase [Actinoplanes sp.]